MKKLYAPWRSTYTTSVAHADNSDTTINDCIFCQQFKEKKDDKYYILRRFKHHAVVLNRYPYNAGHLMILPFEHVANLHDLPQDALHELVELTSIASQIVKQELGADGVNVGLNLGKAAGAGMPAHVHMHVLPRWTGDTNFLPTLGETKAVSFDLDEAFKKLTPVFATIDL